MSKTPLILLIGFFLLSGCSKKAATDSSAIASAPSPSKGEAIYRNTCTACHNINPKLTGAVGPALANSSLELLKTKMLTGSYPTGYTPQRASNLMPKFPHLEADLESLELYLKQ